MQDCLAALAMTRLWVFPQTAKYPANEYLHSEINLLESPGWGLPHSNELIT